MTDKTTKALLLAIAVGLWLNVIAQFLTAAGVGDMSSHLAFMEQWLIRGAPVTVVK